jgi:hypothetical protein
MKGDTASAMTYFPLGQKKNPASWSSVDTVSQYNEETMNFSLMVTMILTSFNDVFNYRAYRLKR